jgi:thiol peroxidase
MSNISFKGKPVQTVSDLPKKGEKAKEFVLVDQDLSDVHLQDFSEKCKLLFTVPSLDTSVCGEEAKHINQLAKDYPKIDFLVISADLPFAQKRFCNNENLKNIRTLSMMRSKDFGQDYGILMVSGPLSGILARSVCMVDEHDLVTYSELVAEITEQPNFDAIKKVLKER